MNECLNSWVYATMGWWCGYLFNGQESTLAKTHHPLSHQKSFWVAVYSQVLVPVLTELPAGAHCWGCSESWPGHGNFPFKINQTFSHLYSFHEPYFVLLKFLYVNKFFSSLVLSQTGRWKLLHVQLVWTTGDSTKPTINQGILLFFILPVFKAKSH